MLRARFKPGQAEAGRAGKAVSHEGSGHDSCPDCAQAQPKRTIIPVLAESQSVTGRVGLVTLVSLTSGRHGPRSGGRRPSPALGFAAAVGGAPEARRAVRRKRGGRCAGRTAGGAPPRGGRHGWAGCALYRLLGRGAVTLPELLSVGQVISPGHGPGMTLVGHAGAAGRVVALLSTGSTDPLSDGGGRSGRSSRSACPRQRGA